MLRVTVLLIGLLQLHQNCCSDSSQLSRDGLTAAKGKRRVVQVLRISHVVWGLLGARGHTDGRVETHS
jgi:hypothetical protein